MQRFPWKFVVFTLTWLFGSMGFLIVILFQPMPTFFRYLCAGFLLIDFCVGTVLLIRATWFKFASNRIANNERIIADGRRKFESIVIDRVEGSPMSLDASSLLSVLSKYLQAKEISQLISTIKNKFNLKLDSIDFSEDIVEKALSKISGSDGGKPFEDWTTDERKAFNDELKGILPFQENKFVADYIVFKDSEAWSAQGTPISHGKRIIISQRGINNELLTEEVPDYVMDGMPRHTNSGTMGTHFLHSVGYNPKVNKAPFSRVLGGESYNVTPMDLEIDVLGYSTAKLRDVGIEYTKAFTNGPLPEPLYIKLLGFLTKVRDSEYWHERFDQKNEECDELKSQREERLSSAFEVSKIKTSSWKPTWPFIALVAVVVIGLIAALVFIK